jgi:prepilin signal peptidase PulO-like enzyme (type II secretory pathway)
LIFLTIFYALVGWLVGLGINHAANILPKRQDLRQWPQRATPETPSAYSDWSVALSLWLKGRAALSHLSGRVIIRSLIIEAVTPIFFVFLLYRYGFTFHLFLVSIYTAILILLTVTDLEHRLIFNVVILPAILLGLLAAFFTPNLAWPSALIGGAGGFLVMYLAALISRGGLGEGDVTLFTFLGLIVGFPHIILNLFFGVFLGGFVVFLLLLTRQVGLKSFVPYGPFLTTTGWVMLVWGNEIWQYYFW